MPSSSIIGVRLTPILRTAAEKRAEQKGLSISDYVRSLIERDTKTDGGEMPQGFAVESVRKKAERSRKRA